MKFQSRHTAPHPACAVPAQTSDKTNDGIESSATPPPTALNSTILNLYRVPDLYLRSIFGPSSDWFLGY